MNSELHSRPQIFTTGAFLQPAKVINSEGKEVWFWYVAEFIDDSYYDGDVFNPPEFANSLEELSTDNDEDSDEESDQEEDE